MPQITDTHQHLWDLERLNLPWVSGVEALNRSFLISDYLQATEGTGVNRTVYMEVDAHPDDKQQEVNDMTLHCHNGSSPMEGMVISADPAAADFVTVLDTNSGNPCIKGVRHVLHTPERQAGSCLTSEFLQGIRELGKRNLLFDICIRPSELPDAVELCRRIPDTTFVLDHCGNPDPYIVNGQRQPDHSSPDPTYIHTKEVWLEAIHALGKLEHVICKISGIVARAQPGWTATTLAPTITACLDTFGEDRVVFGGDWPVCTLGASLSQWINALAEIVSDRPAAFQEKLFHLNAERRYSLGGGGA